MQNRDNIETFVDVFMGPVPDFELEGGIIPSLRQDLEHTRRHAHHLLHYMNSE